MYNYSFEKLGLDYAYVAFDIKEDKVKDAIAAMKTFHMRGCNVTMPDKVEAAKYMDELSPAAQIIGAVNTIVNDDGKLTVYVGNSARKTKMIPILRDLVMGVRRKERGIRVFECSEAEIHLARPLAVHVDGESCMCQENLAVRCIPKRMRVIGS